MRESLRWSLQRRRLFNDAVASQLMAQEEWPRVSVDLSGRPGYSNGAVVDRQCRRQDAHAHPLRVLRRPADGELHVRQ
jgi:hypothetical protein